MRALAIALVAALLAGCTSTEPEIFESPRGLPRSMAALGDSITRAANPDGAAFGDHPEVSWATGLAGALQNKSHAARLLAMGALEGGAHNLARSGARMSDFERQADLATARDADYVTVLFGANDACTRSLGSMTNPEKFREDFRRGAQALRDGLPRATVLVVAIPDITDLVDAVGDDPRARGTWDAFRICQALLADNATEETRATFDARVGAFNEVLREESLLFGFAFADGVLDEDVRTEDVGDLDFFHPSIVGQRRLADETWDATLFG